MFYCLAMRATWRHILLWIGVLGMSVIARAAVYTPTSVPNPESQDIHSYVANPDAIIADSDVVFLDTCAERLEVETNVEMCVVALESIGETDCFDFCYELFQRWGIGKEGQNTGVLVCFVLESHDIRIMTGVGLEGVLPDARCSQIIHDQMIPAFRAGDYGGGLCLGALRIYEICTDGEAPEELRTMRSVTDRGQYAEEEMTQEEMVVEIVVLIVVIILIILIILVIIRSKKGGGGDHFGRGGGPVIMGGFGGGNSCGGGSFGGSWGGGSTMGGGAGGRW